MEFKEGKIRLNVQHLVAVLPSEEHNKYLHKFLEKQSINEKDVQALLKFLSLSLLEENLTIPIAVAFEDCLLLLLTNALDECSDNGVNNRNDLKGVAFHDYQKKAIALAKLMHMSLCVKRYALSYFSNKPPIFAKSNDASDKSVAAKKSRNDETTKHPNEMDIIKCCYRLLTANVDYFKELWNWSDFLESYADMVHDKPSLLKLYVNHIIALLTNMSALKLRALNAHIPEKLIIEFEDDKNLLKFNRENHMTNATIATTAVSSASTLFVNINASLVTNIEGVLLPIYNKNNYEFYSKTDGLHDKIVRVDSTKVNLRSIALGTTVGKAICLSGPVGCGKTTLVEYLARKTGRICPKLHELENEHNQSSEVFKENKQNGSENVQKIGNKRKTEIDTLKGMYDSLKAAQQQMMAQNGFVRVQLGDQTDCKTLLGQYHCTDVPGEFVWLPGVLTQAVMNGYWLLLEDLDSATTDTYTVLSGLLENQYLSVPGFRDCVKIAPGFQLFVTVRNNKSSSNASQKALFSLLEKYLYIINILPLSRNELCKVVSSNYTKLSTVANRIVDVFLTFSKGDHHVADNLRQQETEDRANNTEQYLQLPHEEVNLSTVTNSGRLVSTRDLIKLCQRSNPVFSVTSTECAYFVFQNAVDIFCSYLPHSKEKTKLITSIGAKLGIIQSRCEHFAEEYKPEIQLQADRIKVGRAELCSRIAMQETSSAVERVEEQALKRFKMSHGSEKSIKASQKKAATFSFTRLAACLLERVAVCVANAEPILLVGETGVGKTSSVQYLAERTRHKLVVINMNNQSDVSDLVGGFKPVDLACVIAPLRSEFEILFRKTFNQMKNEAFLSKFSICYNQGNFAVVVKLMLKIVHSVFEKSERNELRDKDLLLLPRWLDLKIKLQKLNNQLNKSINISFAFIPGSLVKCIKNGDWVLLDEINLASAETLECLSTILEPDGSVVLLEKGDFIPVKRHPDFRIFACMNPNTDIGKKDLSVGIRNRFTEFFVDEVSTDADLSLLISDYLSATGIQKKSVMNIVKLYKRLKQLAKLELNDGLGNKPVYSLRTLCRSLCICAKNLCGSIERNLYESFCLSFLTQLDPQSHNVVEHLIKEAMLSNAKAILGQGIPKPGENYLNFEGYWIQRGPKEELEECSNYILTPSVKDNLRDLARIISIGKLPILLQGPTSAGKTSLIDYVARRSGNHCLRINNHEHTDLQEYIGTYTADVSGKLSFKEGVLVQAMRNGYWIILDELNLASTEILEALNRVLDDNRELFIPETQTVVKAHPNFMLFATQNPPGLYGGRKTLSRAFKNRFIELHFSEIPRNELEIILEKKCLIPPSYARKMVACMMDLQKNRKTTTKNVFTLRDLFRWGIRYTLADKKLLEDIKYDWNQHLIEEGYLVLSAKVRTPIEIEIIEEALYKNFRKRIDLSRLFDAAGDATQKSPVTRNIIEAIQKFTHRTDIVWTRNMSRMAVLTAKALQFDEPVLLVGPTGCGKTTVCQILAAIRGVQLRILNCHMHTEGADFLGGLRPCRNHGTVDKEGKPVGGEAKIFEWTDGPLIQCMQEGSYFMADEMSLAEDSVLERLNSVLEPERTVLLAEKGGLTKSNSDAEIVTEFVVKAQPGFQFLATMNPGGDFGKKELSPALRNRFAEIWCLPSDSREDLIQIASNCILNEQCHLHLDKMEVERIAKFIIDVVMYMKQCIDKFKYSVRDILAMANYMVRNSQLSFPEKSVFGLETIFLDALEMLTNESLDKVEHLRTNILEYAIKQADMILHEKFTLSQLREKKGTAVEYTTDNRFGIKPFFIETNLTSQGEVSTKGQDFLFDAPTTKQNLFRLLSALSLQKPILLEGPPGVGKTSIVENAARAIGYNIVRINLCEHTDLADLFGTDLPAEDNILNTSQTSQRKTPQIGSFVWRDGPLLAALKSDHTWILLDELNLAPQSVLEGLNAILDHRGEVYIPELNRTFSLNKQTRIFASQNPLKQGGGRKGLPQSFLNRFTKVYVRKLTTEDLLHVVEGKYEAHFDNLKQAFIKTLPGTWVGGNLFHIYKSIRSNHLEGSQISKITFDLSLRMVAFSETLDRGITTMEFGYRGGPYEINLRDILRWCDLLIGTQTGFTIQYQRNFQQNFEHFLLVTYERMKLVYYQRMRCDQDKQFIRRAFANIFQCDAERLNEISEDISLYWTPEKMYINDIVLQRDSTGPLSSSKNGESTPILLASQREMLKNVIECVHMEKPVLLCGPTDSGKTKLIDTLCCLSNQVCNTDNIDDSVTGSFQQIDLNRHLEEISQKVENIYLHYIQEAISNESSCKKMLLDVYNSWSNFSTLSNAKCEFQNKSVVSEELAIYRKRIAKLNHTIEKLCQCLSRNKETLSSLKSLQNMLHLLREHVENADTLNTGGYFEWVDSQIVKSLKCGQYIALEHVNLCSSAVLDRLNPVFEPNGCLMISEKGVSAENELTEVVTKSPNFRAFLTIDPKNGELSRAMRNRCVELSLTGKSSLDLDDKRLLVYYQGIHDIDAINSLITIHDRISNLTEINGFSVSHLTQMAYLAASYKRIGYTLPKALYVSAMEVYVYSANVDLMGYGLSYYQNKLREIVAEETQKFGNIHQVQPGDEDYLQHVLLNCNSLSETSIIRLQLVPLRIALKNKNGTSDQLKYALERVFSDFSKINLENNDMEVLVKFLIYMVYESSSMNDLKMRHLLLLQELFQHQTEYQKLANDLYMTFENVKQDLTSICPQLPWNSKLFPRIRDYTDDILIKLEIKSLAISTSLVVHTFLKDIPHEKFGKLTNIDALTYSQAVAVNTITDKLNNDFLKYLSTCLDQLEIVLKTDLFRAQITMDSFISMHTCVLWFNRLLETSQNKVFLNKELNGHLLDKLVLHFKWMDKKLIKQLKAILPKNVSAGFESSLQKLYEYVASVKHPLNIVRKLYAKEMIQFQPFYREEQIKLYNFAKQMDHLLQMIPQYGSFSADDVARKFSCIASDTTRKLYALLQLFYTAHDFSKFQEIKINVSQGKHLREDIEKELQQFIGSLNKEVMEMPVITTEDCESIQQELECLAQMLNVANPDEMQIDRILERPKEVELLLLSLREYFLIKYLRTNLQNPSLKDQGPLNAEYCEEINTLDNNSRALLGIMTSNDYKAYRGLWFKLNETLSTSNDMESLVKYLNGGYRQFSSMNRILNNTFCHLQFGSLSSRGNFTSVLRNNEDIQSINGYNGATVINVICDLLLTNDGSFRSVPLCDLDLWKNSLECLNQLLWHNTMLMTPAHCDLYNEGRSALEKAKRLILEIEYITKLRAALEEQNDSSPYMEGFRKLVAKLRGHVLQQKSSPAAGVHVSLVNQSRGYETSLINTLVGGIELCLLTFTPLIDPVEKSRLKNKYLLEDIATLKTMTLAYDFLRIPMKYKHLGEEIYAALQANIGELQQKQLKYKEKVALRPTADKCLYTNLVKDLAHFLSTNCEPNALYNLIQDIHHTWLQMTENCSKEAMHKTLELSGELLNKIDLWIANSQRFVHHILKPYAAYYQDFVQPLECCINQLRLGFEGLKKGLGQIKNAMMPSHANHPSEVININEQGKLHRVLENIVEFPSRRTLAIYNVSSSRSILHNRCPIFSVLDKVPNGDADYFHLLKAKLLELKNRANISHGIDEQLFSEFDFAFNIVNQIWQQEEERRRLKKKEEESLYTTKTKCQDEDEEMQELQEIEAMFPTGLQEDFGEFVEEDNTLEKVMKLDKDKLTKDSNTSTIVRDEDYAFIAHSFNEILIQYSQAYYYPSLKVSPDNLEFVDYYKHRLRVFARIYQHYKCSVEEYLSEATYNSLSFGVSLQQDQLSERYLHKIPKPQRLYNFYKDSNVGEILDCTEVLASIEECIDVELSLYPEHATLLDIKRIIARIRLLPSTASVVRFNTGFQLLRQKVAQWNEVAHKNNHLKPQEQQIAAYVQKWTRLELQFWRNCMSQTEEKVENSAFKYWFFIYNLFQEFLRNSEEIDASLVDMKKAEKRFHDMESEDQEDVSVKGGTAKVDVPAIVQILRQFVESSCYGDFAVRLQLLLSFELYLHNSLHLCPQEHSNDSKRQLIYGLRNLQLYFAQFSKDIEEHQRSIRAPIEKKLKELVKIESYNKDLSYFSMRNNVARVHRNLNKFLKEYEQLLREKITAVFQPKDATTKDYSLANDKGKDLRQDSSIKYCRVDAKYYVLQQRPAKAEQDSCSKDSTLLAKVLKLFNTSRSVVKETVTNAVYPKLVIALDSLLSEQLERCEHLRNLTVDRSKERPKQILEAKSILQQKRKGLTDLFKILSTLGVSYKSGLLELSLRSEFEDFALQPFCIKTMLSNLAAKRLQPQILQLNENLDLYFHKCVFKLKLLQNIMLTPLSELGPHNIERIKGCAIDLFLLVQNQRQLLANTVKQIYDYQRILKQLKELDALTNSTQQTLQLSQVNFNALRDSHDILKEAFVQVRYVFEQFQIFLNCMPKKQQPENCLFSEYVNTPLLVQNSELYQNITSHCENILKLCKSTQKEMRQQANEFQNVNKLEEYRQAYAQIMDFIGKVLVGLQTPLQEFVPLAKPIQDLQDYLRRIPHIMDQIHSQAATVDENFENLEPELENIIHCILMALQKLYKKYPSKSNSDDSASNSPNKKDQPSEDELQEQHLKGKVYGELKDDWHLMNISALNQKLGNIMLMLKLTPSSEQKIQHIQQVLSVQPLLEQFNLIAEYYLLQQLAAHKISLKMLLIILTVFVEIGTKGFCVPQDLMQDEEGEKKKDQKEGEGFGLEDGTGEKDASDKIESEDQLDDAKRPEDRKNEPEKDDQTECKEEKGIEMSEDFEGKSEKLDKPEEDDSGESEEEEELNKEMGETEEGADKLDEQIWGDDEDEDQQQDEEEDLDQAQDGKGSKDEKDLHNDLNSKEDKANENGPEDEEDKGLDATDDPNEDKRKKQEKDIDNMKEPAEEESEQTNPYHNELEEPPEPEDFDLGDMNMDDKEENEEDPRGEQENPFDIDAMKENMTEENQENDKEGEQEEGEQQEEENKNNEEEDSDSDDDQNTLKENKNAEQTNEEEEQQDETKEEEEEVEQQKRGDFKDEQEEEEKEKASEEEDPNNKEEKAENYEPSKDKSSKEENVQSTPDTDTDGSKDQLKSEQTEKDIQQDQTMDEQDTGEEKDGVGQAENETSDGGHQGIAETKETISQEDRKNDKNTQEKRRQGQTNEERTLGEAEKNKLKQLKTIDKLNDQKEDKQDAANDIPDEKDVEADEYQHVKDPKTSDKTTLDNATEEQSKQMQHLEDEEKKDDEDPEGETNENMDLDEMPAPEDDKNYEEELKEMSAEKTDKNSDKPSKSEKTNERAETQEEMEIEGEIVQTSTVARSSDTTAHCNMDLLVTDSSQVEEMSTAETLELRKLYQQQVTSQKPNAPNNDDYETWQTITNRMTQNARDLCEQLRLILEPTKCTRLKGDYRTGRRINMKKIIPYIASQFRKDKIWLRRTKPAQRDYKITIAIDDSKSMHHNNSKTLTLEAISLVSQALALLESGRLSVVSFGEQPQILLNHTEQFDGPKLVNSLQFAQDKTKIAGLLDFIRTVNAEEGALGGGSSDNGLFENLLLILSDGRNIYSEGKMKVKNSIKLARLQRIFLVYIIIDNPDNKNSILDIQTMEMLPDKSINIKSYLDEFPFPYYVIVRDLNQLPLVLSEAMRQWFELVNSEQ